MLLSRFKRPADEIIGDAYLLRWFVIPKNRYFNIYLHCFLGSDEDRALHDHPWHSLSILLKGRIQEHLPDKIRPIARFVPQFRAATCAHRIELLQGPAWTIFISGRKRREWGFHCPQGWRHWREFTDESGKGVGRGCD